MPIRFTAAAVLLASFTATVSAGENLQVAVYARAQEVARMSDPAWLEREWQQISGAVHVDKVYLEVHRDGVMPDDATIEAAKAFFAARGVRTAGGITFTISEPNRFETFSYSDPEHRRRAQMIAETAARHFDEVILDDFFFTSAKKELDIQARGDRSWTDFRLDLMSRAGRDLVVKPARQVNPRVKVIIKYPNWYAHFQALGFNLETGPKIFDGIYTGTETRDAVRSAQHLQPYHGYSIMRYFENIAPGRNGGGWVDPFASGNYDRYAEQLWMTVFAKSGSQVTLFDWSSIQRPLGAGAPETPAAAAARAFDAVDHVLGQLGKPLALRSYRPFHSTGEDHLQSFLGMIGLPMEIVPYFPEGDRIVLLTEEAAADPHIVQKIERHVRSGKAVVITSGLLRALQPRGIEHIAEIEHTGRVALVSGFPAARGPGFEKSDKPILIPQLAYRTNDSWELVSAVDGENGWPLLHDADYGAGHLYVLTVPENFADFYHYPQAALNTIRRVLSGHLPVWSLGAAADAQKVGLFVYDNDTFVVHNFNDVATTAMIAVGTTDATLVDLVDGSTQTLQRDRRPVASTTPTTAAVVVPAHRWRAFRVLKQ